MFDGEFLEERTHWKRAYKCTQAENERPHWKAHVLWPCRLPNPRVQGPRSPTLQCSVGATIPLRDIWRPPRYRFLYSDGLYVCPVAGSIISHKSRRHIPEQRCRPCKRGFIVTETEGIFENDCAMVEKPPKSFSFCGMRAIRLLQIHSLSIKVYEVQQLDLSAMVSR